MNVKEIQRLRFKFIFISMMSILMVMVFIGSVINIFSRAVSSRAIRQTLAYIAENDSQDYGDHSEEDSLDQIFSPSFRRNHFYIFIFDQSAELTKTISNTKNTLEISSAQDYAKNILSSNINYGRTGMFYYRTDVTKDNGVKITMLDCTSEISMSLRLLSATITTCMAGMLITFILVLIFSERAIKPEIENSNRQKEFITNASHELKTPLAVIRANTELLEITCGENEWTKSTLNQVDNMNGLIQNLVMISKAQEYEDKSVLASINVSDIIHQTVAPYKAMAKKAGKALVENIEENVLFTTDESRIRQLVTILIDNAIKYCDDNGRVEIGMAYQKKGKGSLNIVVSNTYAKGADIDCSRFFDRFYREDKSHNIDKGGYGIGLSIAESICSQSKGSIKASYKDGIIYFTCIIR